MPYPFRSRPVTRSDRWDRCPAACGQPSDSTQQLCKLSTTALHRSSLPARCCPLPARSLHSSDLMCTADQGVRVGGCRHCIVKPNTALSITRSGLSMRKPLSEVVLTGEPAGLSAAGRSPARRCSSSPRSMSLCWSALESEDAKHISGCGLTSSLRLWPRRRLYVPPASVNWSMDTYVVVDVASWRVA